ncbi:arginase family protein [Oleiagrimonas sp. MCCC 1A03011]|jgi:agmatinase|uniref:arginase family protein n=1 Tax=Oleiagrimonas sp. MCCC 1A03011 TaxID=1926883 RepID=UPI000DC4DDBE|nr:arginase family protein [Oleiagrimonas sp. MCCC 1A03011]RAP59459.1 hypothetical protein BTJ49_02005 [Oleiagrimonas sp. MCCC 1A03011]
MIGGMGTPTLFDWPDPGDAASESGNLCAIGVPADHGNGVSRGASLAPDAIRRAACSIKKPPFRGVDLGDQADCGSLDLDTILSALRTTTKRVLDMGGRPLVIGGDHSITFAPVSVLQERQDIGVVWFDAHTDFSPWSEGEVHSHKQVLRRIEALPGVKRVVQVGYRGITVGDERCLGPKATVFTTAQARCMPASELLQTMAEELPWYISVDVDVVDPFQAPGTSAPVPHGLDASVVRDFLSAIVRSRSVVGADVVEVNPRLDVQGVTCAIAADFLRAIAGGA